MYYSSTGTYKCPTRNHRNSDEASQSTYHVSIAKSHTHILMHKHTCACTHARTSALLYKGMSWNGEIGVPS